MPRKKHTAPGKSDREGIGVLELFEMFPDEESARKWFENLRWPNEESHCPRCGSMRTALFRIKTPCLIIVEIVASISVSKLER